MSVRAAAPQPLQYVAYVGISEKLAKAFYSFSPPPPWCSSSALKSNSKPGSLYLASGSSNKSLSQSTTFSGVGSLAVLTGDSNDCPYAFVKVRRRNTSYDIIELELDSVSMANFPTEASQFLASLYDAEGCIHVQFVTPCVLFNGQPLNTAEEDILGKGLVYSWRTETFSFVFLFFVLFVQI